MDIRRQGFGLIEIIVATALLGIVGLFMSSLLTSSFKGAKHVEIRSDLEAIRQLIVSSIHCEGTFENGAGAAVDPNSAVSCNSNSGANGQDPPGKTYFRLRRRTLDGSLQWLTPPLITAADGSKYAELGDWAIRTTCDQSLQTLVIRAAKPKGDGSFVFDPLTKKELGWYANRALLFGVGPGAIPLCYVPPDQSDKFNARLSLDPLDPLPIADQFAKTSVHLTPFRDARISVFTPLGWIDRRLTASISVPVPNVSNRNFDIFVYDNNGTLELETVNWSTNTARAIALQVQDRILVKSTDTSRRYVGTGRTTVSGETEDSEGRRFLWNYYNRVKRKVKRTFVPNGSWNFGGTAWRPAVNNTGNRVEIVVGFHNAFLDLEVATHTQAFGCGAYVGIGVNSTTTNTSDLGSGSGGGNGNPAINRLVHSPSLGYSFYQWMERVDCSNANYWSTTNIPAGLLGYLE